MANIKMYSVKANGNLSLSKNFKVKEFKCHDGSDTVKIDLDNVKTLQKIRDYFGKAIHINSAYRTKAYNAKIGGASASRHMTGQAADIVISGVDPLKIYLYALSIGSHGAILYPNSSFVHVDTRSDIFHAITLDRKTYLLEPTGALKQGMTSAYVKWMQYMLFRAGYKITIDGKFDAGTTGIVKRFQKENKLTQDGVFGPKSLAKLKEVLLNK